MSASQKRSPVLRQTAPVDAALAERPGLRRLIGAAVLLHLTAVTVAPFTVLVVPREQPPGGGPLRSGGAAEASVEGAASAPAGGLAEHRPVMHHVEEFFRPYLDLLYLNHGYSFFAPEPGPSYIMQYEVYREDGSVIRGRLPDVDVHWPRLLYHRYFMLATQNPNLMQGAVARGKVPPGSTNTLAHAILRHAMELHDGERGELRLYLHRLLWPEEASAGKSPEDEDTYLFDDRIVLPATPGGPGTDGASPRSAPAEEVDP